MFRQVSLIASTALLMVLAAFAVSPCFAQNAQPNYDKLKKLLDEKFLPPPNPSQKPSTVDKKDLHWIAPKEQSQPQPGKQGGLRPNGDLSWAGFGAIDGTTRPLWYRVADSGATGLKIAGSNAVDFGAPNAPPPATSAAPLRLAQAPAAKRNSYIIQLKPNATEQQIAALLAKYRFRITGGQSSYGLLRVERIDAVTGAGNVETLSEVLNQQIVTQLRREPIVASATVDTTVIRHTIPKASSTSVGKDGTTIAWIWKNISPNAMNSAALSTAVPAPPLDGNWGLKAIRMPAVWTIMARYREAKPDQMRPKLAIIDTGFAKHEDLAINLLESPNEAAAAAVASTAVASCGSAHGNHIAGIAGAIHGNGIGVDGVIPQANIDAVPWDDVLVEGADPGATRGETRTTYFSEALFAIVSYVESSAKSDLRVVNVSLGFNFGANPVTEGDPEKIAGLTETIKAQATMFASLAKKHEDRILFVTAAGNDSTGRPNPFDAKWSSPIVWAATQLPTTQRPKNIIIVEANDRNGQRADFSNIGGHVAAPGVDILSTLWPGDNAYGACPGTSMAAPHVAGIAVLLFELDPAKKPADVVDIIKASAIKPVVVPGGPPRPPGAPRVDALEAVLKLSPDNLVRLADLNRDGKVDIEDMKIFAKHLAAITENAKTGQVFTEDLNGDGVVDANECNWPLIDLNGSGTASLALTDARIIQGMYRSDLDVLQLAWTDKAKDFKSALKETGFDATLQAANVAPPAAASQGCR